MLLLLVCLRTDAQEWDIYEGTIGKYPITMVVYYDSEGVAEQIGYCYDSKKVLIELRRQSSDGKRVELKGARWPDNKEIFNLEIEEGTNDIFGIWTKGDRELKLSAKRIELSREERKELIQDRIRQKPLFLYLFGQASFVSVDTFHIKDFSFEIVQEKTHGIPFFRVIGNYPHINSLLRSKHLDILYMKWRSCNSEIDLDYSVRNNIQVINKRILSFRKGYGVVFCKGGTHDNWWSENLHFDLKNDDQMNAEDVFDFNFNDRPEPSRVNCKYLAPYFRRVALYLYHDLWIKDGEFCDYGAKNYWNCIDFGLAADGINFRVTNSPSKGFSGCDTEGSIPYKYLIPFIKEEYLDVLLDAK